MTTHRLCPFCGGPAALQRYYLGQGRFIVRCLSMPFIRPGPCPVAPQTAPRPSAAQAWKAWDQRTAPASEHEQPASKRRPRPLAVARRTAEGMGFAQWGAAIGSARAHAGLSQAELAALIGTDQGNIARLEGGRSQPTRTTLEKIAKALKRDIVIRFIDRSDP
jgi:ribosome-binding protein aMBF1 (putative translation factor)